MSCSHVRVLVCVKGQRESVVLVRPCARVCTVVEAGAYPNALYTLKGKKVLSLCKGCSNVSQWRGVGKCPTRSEPCLRRPAVAAAGARIAALPCNPFHCANAGHEHATDERPVPVLCVRSRLTSDEHLSVKKAAANVVPARRDLGASLNQVILRP